MKEQLEQRITELQAEFETGQQMLADLEKKQTDLRDSVLRISGAIQVLEEMVQQAQAEATKPPEEGGPTVCAGPTLPS